MTTLAHQGRSTTSFDSSSARTETTRSEVRFPQIKGVNDVVSTTPREFCKHFSDRVTRLGRHVPIQFSSETAKKKKNLHPQRD